MKTVLLAMVLLFPLVGISQKKYYKGALGVTLDEATYNNARDDYFAGVKVRMPKAKFSEGAQESYRNKDSVIMVYNWAVDVGTISENESKAVKLNNHFMEKIPFEKFRTLDGKTIPFSDVAGKPTLVNFWYTSCAPCIAEMKVLNDIKKQFGDKINFIAVTYEPKEKVRKFLKTHKFDFIQITDARELIDKLEISEFPTNVMLDKDGEIANVSGGIPMIAKDDGSLVMSDGKGMRLQLQMALDAPRTK
ncbi:TlpA disulfide reductase family protein [Flavobacterium sp.]|uniref:TlpA family protein disulfide reductase n=1 Tax=Flavobacterium sp. TaxID=239 RepID=UPI0025BD11FB|nr:TlpA disulfide reductase family protein [Flavobacterium sp.]